MNYANLKNYVKTPGFQYDIEKGKVYKPKKPAHKREP